MVPVSLKILSFNSFTDALVKDRTRISSGEAFPVFRSSFTRPMVVVVFPVPAPAITKRDLTSYAIAVSCWRSRSRPSTGLILSPTDGASDIATAEL